MKATLWLWSLITIMLCISQGIYASPIGDFQYTKDLQENFLPSKRTKPSLSIVNPLDVLRQRLLLEIARRQMRENTKQVEINRAILKNVGKRSNELDYYDIDNIRNINDNLLYNTNNNQKNMMDNNNNINNNNNDNSNNNNLNTNNILNNNNNNNLNNNNNILNHNNNINNKENQNINNIDNIKQLNDIDDDNDDLFNNYKTIQNKHKYNINNSNKKINNLNDDDYQIKYIYSLYKNSYSHI